MCEYYLQLVDLINQHGNQYDRGDYFLSVALNGAIKYTKPPNANRAGYFKYIPPVSICMAKAFYDQNNNNMALLTRTWFNLNFPEAPLNGCNLQIMRDIISHIL